MVIHLPEPLLQSLEGIAGFDRAAFEAVHRESSPITSIRLNPLKPLSATAREYLSIRRPVPWTDWGYYLEQRPSFTFDPLFHAGCYYVQEASSMFLEEVIRQTIYEPKPLRVLDLSAAPGGKSTHLYSLLPFGSLLVSNEVIRSRATILRDNLVKWGTSHAIVTNNDPKELGQLTEFFDLVLVDAPCSGSGLFRREPEAIGEWSENNVSLCSQRQQRILADVLPALKNEGILIYATCSFSSAEDEAILDWLLNQFSLESLSVSTGPENGIQEIRSSAGGYGYRFWPHRVDGEGFFIAVFRKTSGGETAVMRSKKGIPLLGKKETAELHEWVSGDGLQFVQNKDTVFAWPEAQLEAFQFLFERSRMLYSGIRMGEKIRDKLIPDHALALCNSRSAAIPETRLERENAIRYLQKKDMEMVIPEKGWRLVSYDGHALGWINALPNRINNYYPKELRILREQPGTQG